MSKKDIYELIDNFNKEFSNVFIAKAPIKDRYVIVWTDIREVSEVYHINNSLHRKPLLDFIEGYGPKENNTSVDEDIDRLYEDLHKSKENK